MIWRRRGSRALYSGRLRVLAPWLGRPGPLQYKCAGVLSTILVHGYEYARIGAHSRFSNHSATNSHTRAARCLPIARPALSAGRLLAVLLLCKGARACSAPSQAVQSSPSSSTRLRVLAYTMMAPPSPAREIREIDSRLGAQQFAITDQQNTGSGAGGRAFAS